MSQVANGIDSSQIAESPLNRFYRTVWRWHFYAGLFVIPFMLMLATTGAIYLFKPQLDAWMYRDVMFVQPAATSVPYTQQVEAVRQAYPYATVTTVTPNVAPNRSTEVELTTADEQTWMVFVNPYSAQVLGDRNEARNLQAIARKIHSELAIGPVGDYLVEMAACWGLVLLLTGLYLWLPRGGFSLWGTFVPRLWSPNRRVFWRDLHAVPGFYGALLVGFLILTGLPWSAFWGETFAQVWNRFPAQMWDDIPQSTVLTGSLNQRGEQVVPWAAERVPLPQSSASEHSHHGGNTALDRGASPHATPISLDTVVTLAQERGAVPGFSITVPEGKERVYTISALPNDPTQEATIHVDQYSGAVLADVRWQDYGFVPKAVEMGIAIHMGKYFGWGNQLLMLLACLTVILLCSSGLVMWWQRRPAGTLGVPALPAYRQQWTIPIAIVAVLGVAFPLVGGSLLVVLLLDYLVISRIPRLQRLLH
jgi:uncharacterized iron-regulated membrane protein